MALLLGMQDILNLSRNARLHGLAFAAALLFAWFVQAQSVDDVHVEPRQKPKPESREKPFRVDVDLVLVPVIRNRRNEPAGHRPAEARFRPLRRGETPGNPVFFRNDEPLSIAVFST